MNNIVGVLAKITDSKPTQSMNDYSLVTIDLVSNSSDKIIATLSVKLDRQSCVVLKETSSFEKALRNSFKIHRKENIIFLKGEKNGNN